MQHETAGYIMIRIAIVDDHAMVRAGLRQFFADQIDFSVVAEASNGREALDIVRKGEVDVIVMDISMPEILNRRRAVVAEVRSHVRDALRQDRKDRR